MEGRPCCGWALPRRFGYMHVPDTSFNGIIAFDKQFSAQLDKDGLIVDERDNSGGQIPDFYTEKLKRQLLAVLAPRDTADVPWPRWRFTDRK